MGRIEGWMTVLFYDDVSITEIRSMGYKEMQFWSNLSLRKIKLKHKIEITL